MSPERALRSSVVLAGSLSESEATRRVFLAAGGLALLGLLLLVGTVWWWRSTRAEHPSLAPLEVMGARRWRKAPTGERQKLVDGVRPEGAETGPMIVQPEPVDLAALANFDHAGFDDLKEIDDFLAMDVDQLIGSRKAPLVVASPVPAEESAPDDASAIAEDGSQAEIAGNDIDTDIGADADADATSGIVGDAADAAAVEPAVTEPDPETADAADDADAVASEPDVVEPGDAADAAMFADEPGDDEPGDDAADDLVADDAADEDAADDDDDLDDAVEAAPGDPLLQRSLYD